MQYLTYNTERQPLKKSLIIVENLGSRGGNLKGYLWHLKGGGTVLGRNIQIRKQWNISGKKIKNNFHFD